MTELNENVTREMNKYLENTTIEEIMYRNKKMFHFKVNLTRSQREQDIDVLDLSQRSYNCLRRAGINTLGQLVSTYSTKDNVSSKTQMRKTRNLGTKSADEILLHLFYYQFNILNEEEPPMELMFPNHIMLLNFNYTHTADLYCKKGYIFTVNQIHGDLNNPKSVIFGYGDELDNDYRTIVNKNENKFLENIKSIKYLEADNYRRLLSFIEAEPYQIVIMGHSCGNSDRTLLNTLFEHKNCVSIKPYYYKWGKGEKDDNYIDLVQNISRNFKDMKLMRDRVVNKTYCKPLVSN